MYSPSTLRIINRNMEFASNKNFERIHEHYQIPSLQQDGYITTTLNVWIEPTDSVGEYILVIQKNTESLSEKNNISMSIFPRDIERLVYSYLSDRNTIKIHIKIPSLFPFRAPHFKLVSATQKTDSLQKIIHQMNCDTSTDHSPASSIEKLVLILLSRILEGLNYLR